MFLRNAWYVAAWGDEITEELRNVALLNESICMFRDSKDKVVALENACPHRKLPLTKGRRKGDAVECGYHGLTFNGTGQCIHAPGQGGIPSNAKVHAYPTEERYGLVWIWMGNPALADTSDIFEIENFDNPDWGMNRGKALEIDCNYLYVTDNLLDPTHVAWVHQSSFGQAATEDTPLRIHKRDDGITVWRWMMDVEPAPFYKKIVEFEGNCDRLQHYEVRYPCHALIRAVFTPAGTGGIGGPLHENTFIMDSYNFMTPETEGRTRYYWFQLRNIRPDDNELSEMMSEDVKHAFEEDREVLNEVQKGMANKSTSHIDLNIDGGQLRYRRQLEVLIDQERTADAALV
ncbi:aromatic ring-hydroxylating dioxygenase subunit alpha [Roseovarius sp. EL26]|uniref:aromatic ring-hydroxylating dioxygenase subunit alpha n=1 Tax=Roseovarius sp. EL26 TaxID=2126672 RepID=UPI000EA17274|nr:aromatic ring-hydroxylating dioxygenase subunit alpha [Roseovarius sp. EL26]